MDRSDITPGSVGILSAHCATVRTWTGLGPVPGIAGRSPSYTMRQLFDMQQGTRNGLWTDLMKPVVEKLTTEDLMNLVAYTASLGPKAQSRAAR